MIWEDKPVRVHNMRAGHSVSFAHPRSHHSFLDDLDRIATHSYEPSDDDILRASLRTLGVREHRLHVDDASSDFVTKRAYRLSLHRIIDSFHCLQ